MSRILYLSPHAFLGGAERSLLVLLRCLDRSRFAPSVLTFEDGPLVGQLHAATIPVEVVRLSGPLAFATQRYGEYSLANTLRMALQATPAVVRLWAAIRRQGPALVHTNGMRAHLLGGLAGRLAGVPVVWHLRDFLHRSRSGRMVRRLARILPTRVIVNSDALGADLGLPGGVRRVYNGVDLQAFSPDTDGTRFRRAHGIAPGTSLVGLVAHLTPWKGHGVFLEACARIAASRPDCRFVIVGAPVYGSDGHAGYGDSVARAASELQLGDRLALTGFEEDVPGAMAALDVLVHASTEAEPFGRTLIEAMASARPVVATRGGGTPEVVVEGETGFLVPPRDAAALADAVLRLLDDPRVGERLGRAGRERAITLFGADRHAAAVEAVYREVLGDPR